jgi:uncharacterized protein (UPF0276 family)
MRRMSGVADRVGLGWRGELCACILDHLDAIDALEVIADDWMRMSTRIQRSLRALNADRPVILHGVALGMASCEPVDPRRLDRMARLVEVVRPEAWSEHLAFVRAGGVEIGHLAAPPRTPATVAGALRNLETARRIVGAAPAVENIATLIEPPCSDLSEAAWTCAIVERSGAPMLLDLHNLYANAMNFGPAPEILLSLMPVDCVRMVHLSGGAWIQSAGGKRVLLDDHLHDVPDPVFALLEELASRVSHPLTVIVERDGLYPEFGVLLGQLERARRSLAAGRARAARSMELAA